jgi:AGCS family alanine or glycine:cation symporter
MEQLEIITGQIVGFMWGLPLVILLVGGGLFFVLHSAAMPYKHLKLALDITSGKHDDNKQKKAGDLSHFQALMVALSGTLGLGNIAGVAVAITLGGAGAVFWMWITAIVGIATKFYTATLAVKYRGLDRSGNLQGGPMYVIREGLGKKWMPLAWLFCIGGMFGALPIFQINQLVQVFRDIVAIPQGFATANDHFGFDLFAGISLCLLITYIVMGKLTRIARVTSLVVPMMVIGYFTLTMGVLLMNAQAIPGAFMSIFHGAFASDSVAGGFIGSVIMIGVQRGAFSNEAGIGTESMAHGAVNTSEPTKEGLVATLGPIVDTLIVCTCTALAILVTDLGETALSGVSLTAQVFEQAFPSFGGYFLMVIVFFLSTSTVLTFWYYGSKCAEFLLGKRFEQAYVWFYLGLILIGAISSLTLVINLIDIMYAVMAIPTMISTVLLAPKVKEEAKKYFNQSL